MEVYTQKRLLPEPPEEFIKRLTEWYDDGKQRRDSNGYCCAGQIVIMIGS